MSAGEVLLREALDALKADPRLARELRQALGVEAPAAEPILFMRVSDFAEHVAMSERAVWSLLKKGLPSVGAGRTRRVDVERALLWIRSNGAENVTALRGAADARRAHRAAAGASLSKGLSKGFPNTTDTTKTPINAGKS
jgi:hypothetical protein